jgi:hypothetical protein
MVARLDQVLFWTLISTFVGGCEPVGKGSDENVRFQSLHNPATGAAVICSSVGLDTPPPTKDDVAKFDACVSGAEASGFIKDEAGK